MCVRCRTGRRRGQGALNSAGLLGRGTLLPVVRSGTAFDSERLGPRHDTNPSLEVMAPMKGCRHGRFGRSRFALEVLAIALRARGRCSRASRSRSLQSRFALEVVAIALRARGRCNRASRSRSLQSRFALEVVAIALRARGRCNRASRSRSLQSRFALEVVALADCFATCSLWCFQSPKAAAVAAAAQTSCPSDSVRTQFGRSLGAAGLSLRNG